MDLPNEFEPSFAEKFEYSSRVYKNGYIKSELHVALNFKHLKFIFQRF
jgi:hypothetical protein